MTVLAWIALVVGGLAIPISLISLLMVGAHHYGKSSDPLGFFIVVFGPSILFGAGFGLLRRRLWGYFLALGLAALFLLSCLSDLFTQPLQPTTTVTTSPGGVPTTTFRQGSQQSITPLLLTLGLIGYLLLPQVRREFHPVGS